MFSENIFQEMLENIILSFADYKEKIITFALITNPP